MITRLLFGVLLVGCTVAAEETVSNSNTQKTKSQEIQEEPPELIANGFDFPVGKPDAKGYYNAQPFGKNTHLGDDWNGLRGGDSDLGDPIYNIAHGKVAVSYYTSPSPRDRSLSRMPSSA